MVDPQDNNPGERVIPAMDNKQWLELMCKSKKELLVLILLELRQVNSRISGGAQAIRITTSAETKGLIDSARAEAEMERRSSTPTNASWQLGLTATEISTVESLARLFAADASLQAMWLRVALVAVQAQLGRDSDSSSVDLPAAKGG
ncbi:hypothetical protein [Comamonas sp. 4034]|uniref:hypothetical protein n=1 Tax=Comamonas sp. 4034 TaxID=3156455 RepID=UPI003D1E3312